MRDGALVYGLVPFACGTGASFPAYKALVVRAVPREETGRALGGVGAIESVAGLSTPIWLGLLYAAAARHGRAALAFYSMTATASASLAVLVARAPPPPDGGGDAAGLAVQHEADAQLYA